MLQYQEQGLKTTETLLGIETDFGLGDRIEIFIRYLLQPVI